MADDWKPGDLALCVRNGEIYQDGRFSNPRPELVVGRCYHVIDTGLDGLIEGNVFCLFLEGVRSRAPNGGFASSRFRKIRPLSDEEREQFAAEMNTREPANA